MYSILKSISSVISLLALACLSLQAQAPMYNMTVFPTTSPYVVPKAINNKGEVTGYSSLTGGTTFNAFLYYPNGTIITLPNLPKINMCFGYDINDNTEIVGYCEGKNTEAFLYTLNNGTVALQGQGSVVVAYGINNAEQITGSETVSKQAHAAVFFVNGTTVDLG
jgi:probable HAF family extracellular repeat protein